MIIEKKPKFLKELFSVLRIIRQDKVSASIQFEKQLNKKIKNLVDFPHQCRASYYFDNKAYRDLIHQGYTIIYKVEKERIIILEIFKWQNR
jgi:plasmid stabilization system protein ParE